MGVSKKDMENWALWKLMTRIIVSKYLGDKTNEKKKKKCLN